MAFSHTVAGRILGVGRNARNPASSPAESVIYENEEEGVRLRRVQDTSMNAIAARHNASLIYGAANVGPEFTMRNLIEVRDEEGNWSPVTGRNRAQPGLETQIAALNTWRETGQIGQIGGSGESTGGSRPQQRPDRLTRDLTTAATQASRPQQRPSLIDQSPTPSPHPPAYSAPTQNPHPPVVQTQMPNALPDQRAAAQQRLFSNAMFVEPVQGPFNSTSQNVLGWTDNQRASRSFGRSAALSGVITGPTNSGRLF